MMNLSQSLYLLADVGIGVVFTLEVMFIASYSLFFNWRRTRAGRAFMFMFLAVAALTLMGFLLRWVGPDFYLREWLRLFSWAAMAAALIRLLWVLWTGFLRGEPVPVERKTGSLYVEARDTDTLDIDQGGAG